MEYLLPNQAETWSILLHAVVKRRIRRSGNLNFVEYIMLINKVYMLVDFTFQYW